MKRIRETECPGSQPWFCRPGVAGDERTKRHDRSRFPAQAIRFGHHLVIFCDRVRTGIPAVDEARPAAWVQFESQ